MIIYIDNDEWCVHSIQENKYGHAVREVDVPEELAKKYMRILKEFDHMQLELTYLYEAGKPITNDSSVF